MEQVAFNYLQQAVELFYINDMDALDLQSMERSYVFRIAHYLQNLLANDMRFQGIVADCEYSKRINEDRTTSAKSITNIDGTQKQIIPDLIVHQRNTHDKNLLFVEIKGYWNDDKNAWGNDHNKLTCHTQQPQNELEPNLGYAMGVFVMLGQHEPHFTQYQHGEIIDGEYPTTLFERRKQ